MGRIPMRLAAVLLVVAAGQLVAADDKDDAVKKDKTLLKGSWSFVSIEFKGGEKFPLAPAAEKVRLAFQDDKVSLAGLLDDAVYVIDPTKKPATIDMKPAGGPRKGETFLGIYRVDKDELKICFSTDQRPKEFASKQEIDSVLWTLKRAK